MTWPVPRRLVSTKEGGDGDDGGPAPLQSSLSSLLLSPESGLVLKGWMPTAGTPIKEACFGCFGCVRREVPLVLVDPLLVYALQAQVGVTARATCSDGDEGGGRLASNDRGREASHREEHLATDRTDRESSMVAAGGTENIVAAMVLRQESKYAADFSRGFCPGILAGIIDSFDQPVCSCLLFRAVISIVRNQS